MYYRVITTHEHEVDGKTVESETFTMHGRQLIREIVEESVKRGIKEFCSRLLETLKREIGK